MKFKALLQKLGIKLNIKLRFKNKATFVAFLLAIIGAIYQILNIFEIVPDVDQSTIESLVYTIADVLVALGVLIDPTTPGISDSDRAMEYDELGGK